jgi:hypothetical protein
MTTLPAWFSKTNARVKQSKKLDTASTLPNVLFVLFCLLFFCFVVDFVVLCIVFV